MLSLLSVLNVGICSLKRLEITTRIEERGKSVSKKYNQTWLRLQFLVAGGVDRVYVVNLVMNSSAPLLNGQVFQVLMRDFQTILVSLYRFLVNISGSVVNAENLSQLTDASLRPIAP